MQQKKFKKSHHLLGGMLIIALVLVGSLQTVQAQKLFFIFGHVNYEKPGNKGLMGEYKYGLGAEAGAGIKIFNKTYATGTLGYSSFAEDKSGSRPGRLSYVPIRFGLRQNFLPLNILFLHADVGSASVKNDVTSGARFTGSFGAGAKLGPIEAQIDYELIGHKGIDPKGTNGWVAFKAGWRFGL